MANKAKGGFDKIGKASERVARKMRDGFKADDINISRGSIFLDIVSYTGENYMLTHI